MALDMKSVSHLVSDRARQAFRAYADGMFRRSVAITGFLESGMVRLALAWVAITSLFAAFKISRPAGVVHDFGDAAHIYVGYALIILAPIAGFMIARAAFLPDSARAQPTYRFAVIGKWRRLDPDSAKSNLAFGPTGFMVSLLIGLLLNVVFRTGEYFLAVPAMSAHAPEWGQAMFLFMTADVIITNFFYMVCFVMALKTVPLFPRMLLFAWGIDILMQLIIAQQIAMTGDVPAMVVEPLVALLNGNITKVLISAAVWLPYLMLSERVNVTYRHRTAG